MGTLLSLIKAQIYPDQIQAMEKKRSWKGEISKDPICKNCHHWKLSTNYKDKVPEITRRKEGLVETPFLYKLGRIEKVKCPVDIG